MLGVYRHVAGTIWIVIYTYVVLYSIYPACSVYIGLSCFCWWQVQAGDSLLHQERFHPHDAEPTRRGDYLRTKVKQAFGIKLLT